MKKSDVYARYGIEYKKGHIRAPWGEWICELLKRGNAKTGKAVWTWSTNTTTCPCHCKGCYAESGCYLFPSVQRTLANHTRAARYFTTWFYRAVSAQLETIKSGAEIRIHAAGDFFNDVYAKAWEAIVKHNPDKVFWTYTKNRKYETLFNGFDNANIVPSLIPGVGINFGHCDYIANAYKTMTARGDDVYICRCGVDENQHCAGCHNCSKHKYVLFIEHSTAYKAVDDPMYGKVAELIANQVAD